MNYPELCLAYLKCYETKNLPAIAELFDEHITLRDWNILVRGKELALAETHKNFTSVQTIAIQPLHFYHNATTVAAELKITLNGTDELFVVDVITFTESGKIQSIRAYKGRGDAETPHA